METDPFKYISSEEFIWARARLGAGFAIDEDFSEEDWPNVEELDLSGGCHLITNENLEWLNHPARRLESLCVMSLRRTFVDHEGVGVLTRRGTYLNQLRHLVLSDGVLCDQGARELSWPSGGMPRLQNLIACRCHVTDRGLWELLCPESSLKQLRQLNLKGNWGIDYAGLDRFSGVVSGTPLLWKLNLTECGIDHGNLQYLAGSVEPFPNLTWLSLAKNEVSQHDVVFFSQLEWPQVRRLKHLDLSECSRDYESLFRVLARDGSNLDSLWSLALRGTRLTDAAIVPLADHSVLPALKRLDVRDTKVSYDGVKYLKHTRPSLEVLA